MQKSKTTLAPFALVIAAFIWGGSFIALKYSLEAFSPYFVIFARMLIASICFLCLRRFWGSIHYQKGDWKYLLLMSLGEPCLYFTFEAYALKYTSAGSAGVMNSLLPPLVAFSAWIFLKEHINKWGIIGFITAIIGSVGLTLVSSPSENAPNPILGNTLEFFALLSACLYIINLAHISKRYSAFFLTALNAFIGMIFFFPFVFIEPILNGNSAPNILTIISIFYLSIGATIGAYFLYAWGIAQIGAAKSSVYMNLIAVFSLLLSIILLGESISLGKIFCVILILSGVLMSQIKIDASSQKNS